MLRRSVIARQQHFLVRCEARAWSLNRLLPPDGPAPPSPAAAAAPPAAGAGGAPDRDDGAAATARQVTEGMARRGQALAGRLRVGELSGVAAAAKAAAATIAVAAAAAAGGGLKELGLVGLRRSSSLGGQGGGLAGMAQQN